MGPGSAAADDAKTAPTTAAANRADTELPTDKCACLIFLFSSGLFLPHAGKLARSPDAPAALLMP